MRLRHEPLEIVDEAFAAVFRVLEMAANVDRLFRAHFLAVPAEDAPELVYLEEQRIPIAVLVFSGHQLDAVCRAHRRAQPAGDALGLSVLRREHAMCATPAW